MGSWYAPRRWYAVGRHKASGTNRDAGSGSHERHTLGSRRSPGSVKRQIPVLASFHQVHAQTEELTNPDLPTGIHLRDTAKGKRRAQLIGQVHRTPERVALAQAIGHAERG